MESNRRCVREWININNYHYEVVVGASEEPTKATFTYRRDKSFPFCIRHLTDSLCDGNSRGSLQCAIVSKEMRECMQILTRSIEWMERRAEEEGN